MQNTNVQFVDLSQFLTAVAETVKNAVADVADVADSKKPAANQDQRWPEYMNQSEAAHYLNVSLNTLRKWIAEDTIPYKTVGSMIRFSRKQLDEFMEK